MTTPRHSTLVAGTVFAVASVLYIVGRPPLTEPVSTSPIPVYVVTSTTPPATVRPPTTMGQTTTITEGTDTTPAEPTVTSTTTP